MIVLEGINLNREFGKLELDRQPRSDAEFRALNMILRGLDDLLAGREPGAEFTTHVLTHPAVQEARLRYAPVGRKQ
jgi:hypothetical protein